MPKIPIAPPVIPRFRATTPRICTKAMVARARKMPRNRRAGTPTTRPRMPETTAATVISISTSPTG